VLCVIRELDPSAVASDAIINSKGALEGNELHHYELLTESDQDKIKDRIGE